MGRRALSFLAAAVLGLTSCAATTNTISISERQQNIRLRAYEIDELIINDKAYRGVDIPVGMTARVHGTDQVLDRAVIKGQMFIPYDNSRETRTKTKVTIKPNEDNEEIYFLVNVERENGETILNNGSALEEIRTTYSSKDFEESIVSGKLGIAHTRKTPAITRRFGQAVIDGERLYRMDRNNSDISPVALNAVYINKDAEPVFDIKRQDKDTDTKRSLQQFTFIPIRGTLVPMPQSAESEEDKKADELIPTVESFEDPIEIN